MKFKTKSETNKHSSRKLTINLKFCSSRLPSRKKPMRRLPQRWRKFSQRSRFMNPKCRKCSAILITYTNSKKTSKSHIEETEKNYNEALVLFYNRARVMYQYAQYDSLRLFTESKDIFDFANRDRLFARMMENDRKTLEDLEIMRKDLESKKKIQEQMKVDAEALVAEKEAVIAAIENNEAITMEKLQAKPWRSGGFGIARRGDAPGIRPDRSKNS